MPHRSKTWADEPLSMSAIHGMPGHLIRRLQQISVSLFSDECAGLSLTPVQFAALTAISENPGIDATRLSAIIAFDRSTIGDVLERLEGKGWIARSPSPADRRVKLLKLAPAGARILNDVRPAVARVQDQILAPLLPEDRTRFVALLAQLVDEHHAAPAATLDAAE